jgi:hypothetical protein
MMGGDTLWHLQRFLQCIYSLLLPFSFIPPPLIPGVVSTGIIFAFTYMHRHFCTIFTLLNPFPNTSPLPQVPVFLPEQDLFCPPVLQFCRIIKIKLKWKRRKMIKWKTWHFCLFEIKVATHGISLWISIFILV